MTPREPEPAAADRPVKLALESVTYREIDEEIVALDRRTWLYVGINGSGTVLWKEIVAGATRAQLVQRLCKEYGIEAEVAERDVDGFLQMLESHDLLARDDAS